MYEERTDSLRAGFLTDKGPFAMWIKEGLAMNHHDMRWSNRKGVKTGRYARLQEVISD